MKSKTLRRLRLAFARHSLPHHEQFMARQTNEWSAQRECWTRCRMSKSHIESCRLMQSWTARRAAGHYDPAPPVTFN